MGHVSFLLDLKDLCGVTRTRRTADGNLIIPSATALVLRLFPQ